MPIELQRRRPPIDLIPSKAALRLISEFEGLSLKSYPDPGTGGDPWTAGYGHTGPDVTPGMAITLKQADDWLAADIEKAAGVVRSNVFVALTQGEFDALCSLAFNLGYVPRSLKACLNGGITDKGDKMEPGSYGSALKQFPRNCRAAGMPMRGLLRRRLAEACVFSDLPWEAACSINLIRLKCDAKGVIDPDETTSLEDTLERARQDVPMVRPPIDVTKPWPEVVRRDVEVAPAPLPDSLPGIPDAINSIPTQLPLPSPVEDEDELFLDTPAAPIATDAKGSPPVSPQPIPAAVPSSNPVPSVELSGPGTGPAAAEKVAPRPSAPPVAVPRITIPAEKPKAPPAHIDTSNLRTENMKVDQKPMEFSDRAMWFAVKMFGFWLKVMAGRGAIPLTAVSYYFDFFNDPFLSSVIISGGTWLMGECVERFGAWKLTLHRSTASTALV